MKRVLPGALLLLVLLIIVGCQATSTQPTPTPTPTPGLTLVITEPKDEAVVKDSLLRVAGYTSVDAVVSVNGNIIRAIDARGNFATAIPLQEGPNLVEVIATDYQGNRVSKVLTVIYAP